MPKSGVLPYYVGQLYKIFEDWNDNALSVRDRKREDAIRCFDLLKYRPEWTTDSGSPSVSNGQLILPAGDVTVQRVYVTSGETEGTWETAFTVVSTTSVNTLKPYIIYTDTNNAIYITIFSDGTLALKKADAGTYTGLISSTWDNDTAKHTTKVTRDSSGNYELFYDGTSQGTATDTFLPASADIAFHNELDSEVNIDNLKVY